MIGPKLDLYTKYKSDYAAPRAPALVHTRAGQYLSIEGQGEPGGATFTTRLGLLYNVAFTIKMAKKFAGSDYAVSKLEGLWWGSQARGVSFLEEPRAQWRWRLLIRTPDFIGKREMAGARATLLARGKSPDVADVQLQRLAEGSCVQMLHVGPYTSEPESLALMHRFAAERNLTSHGLHHEIYLSDPRRVAAARLRTILRMPVRGAGRRNR